MFFREIFHYFVPNDIISHLSFQNEIEKEGVTGLSFDLKALELTPRSHFLHYCENLLCKGLVLHKMFVILIL